MEYYKTEVKSGCFLVLAASVLIALLFWLGGGKRYMGETTTYVARFTNVSQIRNNSPIFMFGKNIGRISDTRVRNEYAEVVCEIRADIKVYENAKFVAKQINVLGQLFVFLEPGTVAEGWDLISPLADDTPEESSIRKRKRMQIPGIIGTSIEAIMQNTQDVTKNVNKTIIIFNEKQADLLDAITNISNEFAAVAKKTNENFDANLEQVTRTLENVEGITSTLKEFLQKNTEQVELLLKTSTETLEITKAQMVQNGEELKKLIVSLQQQLDSNVSDLLSNLTKLTKDIDETVIRNRRTIFDTMKNIREISDNLKVLSLKLKADPSILIFGSDDEPTDYKSRSKLSRDLRDKGRMPEFGHRK